MIFDHLILMIGITVIIFIIILLLDDQWKIALPLIMVNMMFIPLIVYGFWNVEWFYLNIWNETAELYSTDQYSVYSYVFIGFWFIHLLLLFKMGYHAWQDAMETKGEIDYDKLKVRHRR